MSHVQDRLQHLENLVLSFAQQKRLEDQQGVSPGSASFSHSNSEHGPPNVGTLAEKETTPLPHPGRLVVKDDGISYIDGAHWRAILDEINEMKASMEDTEEDTETIEYGSSESSYPQLLFGIHEIPSKDELLADLPPRSVADYLISRVLEIDEPSIALIHIPTFLKQYYAFWLKLDDVSIPWLGFFFSVLGIAASSYMRYQRPLPDHFGNLKDARDLYLKRTAQCIVLSNYTVPGRYKVETLMLYTWGELFRNADAQVGLSFLIGITYSSLGRRNEATVLVSPLPNGHHDSVPNLHENAMHLPPSRPETERTPASYIRAKGRIMYVFGQISDLAYSHHEPVPYGKVLELDKKLDEAHDLMPPFFQIRPLEMSIGDRVETITRRFSLDILYQKARWVLHRRYLADVGSDPRYDYSRYVCINAAKQVLRHQVVLYHESQPGGRLYGDIHVTSSLQTNDYLAAAMIICVEVSQNREQHGYPGDKVSREELLSILEKSHNIFKDQRDQSTDAQRGCDALAIMLSRVKAGRHGASNCQTATLSNGRTSLDPSYSHSQDSPTDIRLLAETPIHDGPQSSGTNQLDSVTLASSATEVTLPQTRSISSAGLGVIEDMLNTPSNIDWQLWELRMQGFDTVTPNNLTYSDMMSWTGINEFDS
ncbi:hypothetical protein MPDQ_000529 [Monascus purpureus]|uniref:Transcription factor domain-containing protein n=1 Tax=Monascus purpureus TaxID=5098 RepID=A0A507R4J5_MONPU|nr:hypothetical protein MPDQ_000529 [Monascus purpureus]